MTKLPDFKGRAEAQFVRTPVARSGCGLRRARSLDPRMPERMGKPASARRGPLAHHDVPAPDRLT